MLQDEFTFLQGEGVTVVKLMTQEDSCHKKEVSMVLLQTEMSPTDRKEHSWLHYQLTL